MLSPTHLFIHYLKILASFANGPGDQGSISDQVIQRLKKMVLDAALLNIQHYKVWLQGKVK